MSNASTAVVVNSGPLMALGKLNRLDLLAKLYDEVVAPRGVYDEVVVQGLERDHADALTVQTFWEQQGWPIEDVSEDVLSSYRPDRVLDAGEMEVLSLARTLESCLVLLDDETARAEARRLGLRVKGTLGVLVSAYRQGVLSIDDLDGLLHEISARPDIWISDQLCRDVFDKLRREEAGD